MIMNLIQSVVPDPTVLAPWTAAWHDKSAIEDLYVLIASSAILAPRRVTGGSHNFIPFTFIGNNINLSIGLAGGLSWIGTK